MQQITELKNYIEKNNRLYDKATGKYKETCKAYSEACKAQIGHLREPEYKQKVIEIKTQKEREEKHRRELLMRLTVAVQSLAELAREAMAREFSEGGQLFNIPLRYKKFDEIADRVLEPYKMKDMDYHVTDEGYVCLMWGFGYNVYLNGKEWVCHISCGIGHLITPDIPAPVYNVGDIDMLVKEYLKQEKAMFLEVKKFEEKAEAVCELFPYMRPKENARPTLIYGKYFVG